MEPTTNYRRLNVYPSHNEILGEQGYLRKNIIKGKYRNVDHYLDIHFRLLREDFVACLREGIQSYRSNESTKNIDIYENTKIFKDKNKYNEDCLKIKIPKQDEDSKKFMSGSLLIFTKNKFNSMFMAKVTRRNDEDGEAIIELVDIDNNNVQLNDRFTMAESGAYFDPYFQVLTALQTMPSENFPMEKYLIQVDTTSVYIPRYLLNSSQNYEIGNYRLPPNMLPRFRENCLKLNESQFTAFKAALSQEFVVIQGPPGTGKTFLGLKIAETLIRNCHFWYRNSPILVVSQKNFALDQFLEGLIPITKRLIRVGGQSKSEKLKEFNLSHEKMDHIANMFSRMSLNSPKSNKRSPRDYLSAMKGALVVGMTTSLAARWRSYLQELKSPIVIVEEAAEVLEAHVVASLTTHCQHLILLGDHQQLQPLTSNHCVGKNYNLGVSLFERIINNGIQCYKLDVQHRMRPEISNLLKARIYPFLRDHDSVYGRPPIAGVDRNVFFINHQWPEETSNVTSKKNTQEAKFLVALARHLLLNGYKETEIVILATYAGQLPELEKCCARSSKGVKKIKVMTVDAFQGREAAIVLLSLVRSEQIGFLSMQNRVCVALSRARNGFYIAGNMDMLSKKSGLWYEVKKCLKIQNSIGKELPLRCQIHPTTVTKVGCADDFLAVRDGGCTRKCEFLLNCGHRCQKLCHTKSRNHKCQKQCQMNTARHTASVPYVQENRNNYQNTDLNYANNFNYYNVGDVSRRRLYAEPVETGFATFLLRVVYAVVNGLRNLYRKLF